MGYNESISRGSYALLSFTAFGVDAWDKAPGRGCKRSLRKPDHGLCRKGTAFSTYKI